MLRESKRVLVKEHQVRPQATDLRGEGSQPTQSITINFHDSTTVPQKQTYDVSSTSGQAVPIYSNEMLVGSHQSSTIEPVKVIAVSRNQEVLDKRLHYSQTQDPITPDLAKLKTVHSVASEISGQEVMFLSGHP